MDFYLGTHEPAWLAHVDVPLMVSHRRLQRRPNSVVRAKSPWMLDSGGFTELSTYGRWETEAKPYIDAVRRYSDVIGNLTWAAPQDWMCEPFVVAKTGLTVAEHQRRTVANLLELRGLAPELPIFPVLQGYTRDEYLEHVEQYRDAGVDLATEPLVGIGSVCRRQATKEAATILRCIAGLGIRLHGFGLKIGAFRNGVADQLASADSMAWSYRARKIPPMDGHRHVTCSNCRAWALTWREGALKSLA